MHPSTIGSLLALTLAAFTGLAGVTSSSPVPVPIAGPGRVPDHPPPRSSANHHKPPIKIKYSGTPKHHNTPVKYSGKPKHHNTPVKYSGKPKHHNTPVKYSGKPKHHNSASGHDDQSKLEDAPVSGSIKDTPGLSDSKRKPPLKSGNIVITADPSIVLRSNDPNASFPPSAAFRESQGLDTLRGFLNFQRNATTGADDVETTIAVFDVPEIARGKYCSFHFFFGSGDSSHVREEFTLWSLSGLPTEFETTWLDRPARYRQIGQIHPGEGPLLSLGGEGGDGIFKYEDTPIVPYGKTKTLSESIAFPCEPLIGKHGFELVVRPTKFDEKGRAIVLSSAWSMNKGLMIEIHGVKAQTGEEQVEGVYDTDNFEVEDEGKNDEDEDEDVDEDEDEDEW